MLVARLPQQHQQNSGKANSELGPSGCGGKGLAGVTPAPALQTWISTKMRLHRQMFAESADSGDWHPAQQILMEGDISVASAK